MMSVLPFLRSYIFMACTTLVAATNPAIQDPKDPLHEYNFAWKYFEQGDYSASQKIVNRALDRVDTPHWRASYLVLQSNLLGKQRGQSEAAIDLLEEARGLFRDIKSEQDVDYVDLILVKHYLDIEEHYLASALLDNLYKKAIEVDDVNLGYLYFLYARLGLQTQRYEGALTSAYHAVEAYDANGDEDGAAQTQSTIGLLLLLLGRDEEGMAATIKCQEGIIRQGNVSHYFYTLVNAILYQRCYRGQEEPATIQIVEARLQREYDSDLERLLKLCLAQECH